MLKLIKAKSAVPERVFSLQNFIMDHHFLLTLLEPSNLCFYKHKLFRSFLCRIMLVVIQNEKKIFIGVVSGGN